MHIVHHDHLWKYTGENPDWIPAIGEYSRETTVTADSFGNGNLDVY